MVIFFEIIKSLFFLLTVIIGIFYLQGKNIRTIFSLNTELFPYFQQILLPGYLVLCGIIIGYVIGQILLSSESDEEKTNGILVKGFLIGTLIGVGLALYHIYFVS